MLAPRIRFGYDRRVAENKPTFESLMCAENEKMTEIDLEIEDSLLFDLMKRAHEADMTLNRYIEKLLGEFLDGLDRHGIAP